MSKVKLAIRVRPFTERELKSDKEHIPVIDVIDDNTVAITNVKVNVSGAGDSRARVRRYFADYAFDSACPITSPQYASQEKIFSSIGREVLSTMARGFCACVLTYGQSSTGKTYTMMGSEGQPGLALRLCQDLARHQELSVSFLEIYNERVHDLLAGDAPVVCHSLPRRRGNARKDLRVREHPNKGPYVQNLRRVSVQNPSDLLVLVNEGTRRRKTAATKRNSTSSRSHALLELTTPTATLHLADLAGSEKASWEGCGGGRQKEGANINKSLVALSNVISALVSGDKGRGRFVPYRDSALTWLLKDCFTGGANTFIIATVSPSVSCYGESASTLRWAERARRLPVVRPVSGPSAATRTALQTQLNRLIAELARHHIRYIPESGTIAYDDNHWTLKMNKDTNSVSIPENIGNLTNLKVVNPNPESLTSSVASGSSEVINTMDKKQEIVKQISQEVDKLFGPALERTRSGSDLKMIAPYRNKRRQYRSQEVLPFDQKLQIASSTISVDDSSSRNVSKLSDAPSKEKSQPITTLYDNHQRAEIVASVTERLYSKLKKKEEAAVSKMESMVDKKIMEPLSELRICTNARQRLMELSQKAIRHKRRIGIPAHTQTRASVKRVKDQGIDVQSDLEFYTTNSTTIKLYHDVATETTPITPRCKEIAVGSKFGSLSFSDRFTTMEPKPINHRSSFMNTDIVEKCSRCTQTVLLPPPRRKRRTLNYSKYPRNTLNKSGIGESTAPVISINISQMYNSEAETQSSDDNNLGHEAVNNVPDKNVNVVHPPDLLSNHNTVDSPVNHDIAIAPIVIENFETSKDNIISVDNNHDLEPHPSGLYVKPMEDFPELEEFILPRVSPALSKRVDREEIKDIILGRNDNIYPYNIVMSPPREREESKRIVKFKDIDTAPNIFVAAHSHHSVNSLKSINSSDTMNTKKSEGSFSCASFNTDFTSSSNSDTESFIWKKGCNRTKEPLKKTYTPIYKSNSQYRRAKTKLYKDFLGLEKSEHDENNYNRTSYSYKPQNQSPLDEEQTSNDSTDVGDNTQLQFLEKRQFFENKLKNNALYYDNLERKIMDSCSSLENSVNKYDMYLKNYENQRRLHSLQERSTRTPTEYLQHLVQLRREVVNSDYEYDQKHKYRGHF